MKKENIEKELSLLMKECPEVMLYEVTDSTNTRAAEYARENPGKRDIKLFIADTQTGGRGRRGRSFESPAGAGIYMSLLLYPERCGFDATVYTAYTALAAAMALEENCGISPKIKWINDLFINGKKLAGILAEGKMDPDGKMEYLVIGLGINVYKNSLSNEISAIATTLEEASGKRFERERIIAALASRIIGGLYCAADEKTLSEYKERMELLGENISVRPILGEEYTARAVDVLSDYSLLVERESGEKERVYSAEVSARPLN